MSYHSRFQPKKKKDSFRKFILITGSIGLFFLIGSLAASFYLVTQYVSQPEVPDISGLVAQPASIRALSQNLDPSREPTPMPTRLPPSLLSEPIPEDRFINRLLSNQTDSNSPDLKYQEQPQKNGPSVIEINMIGKGLAQTHQIGQATATTTDIVGAAAEWTVRPWWKPGWVPQTVDCGEEGTAAIAGHVSWGSKPGPFYSLGSMTTGDRIRCLSSEGRWHLYVVSEVVRIDYDETQYYWESRQDLNPAQLTLFTCTPEITGIIVVRAELVSNVAVTN